MIAVPAIDSAVKSENPTVAGDRLAVTETVSFVPAAEWNIDTGFRVGERGAVDSVPEVGLTRSSVNFAVAADSFDGTPDELLTQIDAVGSATNGSSFLAISGARQTIVTDGGLTGVQVSFNTRNPGLRRPPDRRAPRIDRDPHFFRHRLAPAVHRTVLRRVDLPHRYSGSAQARRPRPCFDPRPDSRARESHFLRDVLAPEVESGVLTDDEVTAAGGWRQTRQYVKASKDRAERNDGDMWSGQRSILAPTWPQARASTVRRS